MEIRRRIFNNCKGDPQLQKAVAFAIYVKYKFGRSSMMRDFTINKIHKLTGISPTTIKKYLQILSRMGYLSYQGKNNQHLIICRLSSHTDRRNITIDKFCFDSFKDVYRSLRAYVALSIQAHKDFIRRTIQTATDPKRGQNFKAARNIVKRLVRNGILKSVYGVYRELGISYKRIAKETGNCVRTAQRIIQYAVSKKWVTKHTHFEQVFAPKVNFHYVEGFTFSTMNNLYRVLANTYVLEENVGAVLCSRTAW